MLHYNLKKNITAIVACLLLFNDMILYSFFFLKSKEESRSIARLSTRRPARLLFCSLTPGIQSAVSITESEI